MEPLAEDEHERGEPDFADSVIEQVDISRRVESYLAVLPKAERKAMEAAREALREDVDLKEYCIREGLSYTAVTKAYERAKKRIRGEM